MQFVNLGTFKENAHKQFNEMKDIHNNSTLSLHISTYEENSIETYSNEKNEFKAEKFKFNKSKTFFQESVKQFEIPRQQKDMKYEPEIMQFKASQSLINPNDNIFGIRNL